MTGKGKKQVLECLLQEPSKMSALVTVNNIWNSEEDKECLGEAIDFRFSVIETYVTLIYVLDVYEERNYQSSLPLRGQ